MDRPPITTAPPSTAVVDFAVRRMAWSPDDRQLAVAGDGTGAAAAALVNADSGELEWQVSDLGPSVVQSIAFAPDGTAFAVGGHRLVAAPVGGGGDGWAKLLDRRSGTTRWAVPGGWVFGLVFSPDSRLLAIAEPNRVRLIEVATGTERFTLPATTTHLPFTPAFSADSRSIALLMQNQCQLRDTATGDPRWTAAIGPLPAWVAFDADGTRLVVAHYNNAVDLLAADTGTKLASHQLQSPIEPVPLFINATFEVSADGTTIAKAQRGFTPATAGIGAWGTGDGSPRFPVRPLTPWPVPSGISPVYISQALPSVRFSPDGRRLVVAAGETAPGFMLLDAQTGDKLHEDLSEPATVVGFDRHGHGLAVAGERSVRIFLADAPKLLRDLGGPIKAVTLSAGEAGRVGACTDRTAMVFDVESGERLLTRAYNVAVLRTLRLSPDGRALAAADAAGVVDLHAVAPGSQEWHVDAPGSPVIGMAFLPGADGDLVTAAAGSAAAGLPPAVRRLALADGAQRWECPHQRGITRLAVDPTGRRVATASADGMTRVLDAGTGEVQPFPIQRSGASRALVFTRDGSTLISADANGVVLVDPATGRPLGEVAGPGLITAADVSGDGSLLATAAEEEDHRLRLYDLTGETPAASRADRAFDVELTHVLFDSGGQRLWVATDDGIVWLLDLPTLTTRRVHRHPQPVDALTLSGSLLATVCGDVVRVYAGSP